jgi:hypothetical protein
LMGTVERGHASRDAFAVTFRESLVEDHRVL